MRIDILTLFPDMLAGPFDASIIGRARAASLIEIAVHNPRDWAHDKHRVVDDYAYGGGPGMVMKPEPLFEAVEAVREMAQAPAHVVLLTPQGRLLTNAIAAELAERQRLILICGHYEGVDERVRTSLADDEISIGDYVLSGGEAAAIVLVDAVVRHVPGVLGSEQSLTEESHGAGLLEYPQYTRPPEYRGERVPDVLLSGDHAEVARWRRAESITRTARRRPDMLAHADLSPAEQRIATEALGAGPGAPASLLRVELPVADLAQGVAFYRALLSAEGEAAAGRHDFRCGGATLSLIECATDEGFCPNTGRVYLAVPDLKERHAAARKAGGGEIERIVRQPSGEKSFCLRDPFGNRVCFVDERKTGGESPGESRAE